MIATLERKPLGQLLMAKGLIQQEQLERALEEQKKSGHQKLLGEVFVEMHMCSEEQICESLAQAYGVPYARVGPKIADPKTIAVLPKEFLEKHQVLPLFLIEGILTVAVPEPANVFLLEEIERLSGYQVQVVAATVRDIKSTLQAYLPNDQVFVIDDIIEEVQADEFSLIKPEAQEVPITSTVTAGDTPVIKLVNYVIFNAVREGASDIHIEPGENVLRIRYRIDGRLVEKLRPPYQMHAAVASRIKTMCGLDPEQRHLPQDGGLRVMMEKRPVDLLVGTMPGKTGEKIVIRVVDTDKALVNLEKLGFSYDTLKAWRKLITQPNGIALVAGPDGSGKTTTLYATLQELNRPDLNICTIEDPIDCVVTGINQFQVNEKTGFTYPTAMRALLRQDPDIMMIGELRDGETAKLAAQAALTGHLILSTLHTNDAPSAFARLFNIGVEPYLVGATVAGVMCQRLVRKLCQHCREGYEPAAAERRQIERYVGTVDRIYRPKGCSHCRNIGYAGRMGIYELLVPDEAMIEKISQGATINEIRDLARTRGFKTLRGDGMDKVKSGMTTVEEVYRVTA
jgi:type IV pilus assembly protein PilB